MADSLKRVVWAKDAQNQDRINYYLFQKSLAVMAEATPDPDELAFARNIYAGDFNAFACAMVVVSNATIGAVIDADGTPSENDIDFVVSSDQWANLAGASQS